MPTAAAGGPTTLRAKMFLGFETDRQMDWKSAIMRGASNPQKYVWTSFVGHYVIEVTFSFHYMGVSHSRYHADMRRKTLADTMQI